MAELFTPEELAEFHKWLTIYKTVDLDNDYQLPNKRKLKRWLNDIGCNEDSDKCNYVLDLCIIENNTNLFDRVELYNDYYRRTEFERLVHLAAIKAEFESFIWLLSRAVCRSFKIKYSTLLQLVQDQDHVDYRLTRFLSQCVIQGFIIDDYFLGDHTRRIMDNCRFDCYKSKIPTCIFNTWKQFCSKSLNYTNN